jgi:glycine/D-amino acid oxidase-like deaminating enzyme
VRVCIVGGGLAGSLLAWRLAHATTDWRIDVLLGGRRGAVSNAASDARSNAVLDATAASGGSVRAFEADPEQRQLAIASMVELLASRTLRQWSDYRPARVVNLRRDAAGLDAAIADIELMLPGSVSLADRDELAAQGWADLHAGAVGVVERGAGYTSPARWRDAVLADLRHRVTVSVAPSVAPSEATVARITLDDDGTVTCATGAATLRYDAVVVAAGAWTAALLRASGLPAAGYRTKSIQYALHPMDGTWSPPQFVDAVTGLYGRPTADGGLLLGLPTEQWDVDPDRPPTTPALLDEAARLARARFPRLRIGPATRRVGSADCYAEQPILSLRPVLDGVDNDGDHRLYTFTGGAGGSVKTALAASRRAAIQLVEQGSFTELTSVGRRKGQQ